jgi:hypothetical protein
LTEQLKNKDKRDTTSRHFRSDSHYIFRKPWYLSKDTYFAANNNFEVDLSALGRSIADKMLDFWNPPEEMVEDESTRGYLGECPVRQYAPV